MSESAVLYEVTDHVAVVTLNRADNRNSMTPDVMSGLSDAVARVRGDAEVRCLVVTGRGRSFCAGADFRSRESAAEGALSSPERTYGLYEHFLAIGDVEVPTIAAMNGHAIGGGLGLALVCDLRVANQDARYGANFVRLGLHPGMATTWLLPRLLGVPRAVELLLTGRLVSGAEAAQLGLAHYAEPADAVMPRALALAREIATAAPQAVRWTKQSIYRHLGWQPREAARYEAHLQSRTAETLDHREGVAALLEKRDPVFRGR